MSRIPVARILLAGALSCAVLPGAALADTRADIEARYEQLRLAMDTREPKQIKPLLTPDFTSTDIGGNTVNADQMIDRLAMIPVDPERKTVTTIQSLTVEGATAKVEQRMETSGTRQGRDGAMHTFAMSSVSHDVWMQNDKGWMLKATETQSMTMSRDGAVVRTLKKGDPMPARGSGGRRMGPGGPGAPPMGPDGSGPPLPPPADD